MDREDIYIEEAVDFLKNKSNEAIKNFFLIYLISYYSNHINIKSWNEEKACNVTKLKAEAKEKINQFLFNKLDEQSAEILKIIDWIKKNPPIYSKKDVLGNIYLLCSKNKNRKKLGEHYTQISLVEYIVEELNHLELSNINILDPACGSGNFLICLLRKAIKECQTQKEINILVEKLYEGKFINGIDIQEIPCIISIVKILIELAEFGANINSNEKLPIYQEDALDNDIYACQNNNYDLIITNPPYLRYQAIDSKKRESYKENYFSSTGHFDLYTIFIEKCIDMVKQGSDIVIICSDKFMITSYGRGIRKFIKNNARLNKVIDLSDFFPFDADVLSGIYFFTKSLQNKFIPKLIKLSLSKDNFIQEEKGYIIMNGKWRYTCKQNEKIIKKVYNVSGVNKLDSIGCKISLGFQTTADNVFCKKISDNFFQSKKIRKELIYPFLRGKDIKKWNNSEPSSQVLYPYIYYKGETNAIDLSNYPNAKKYLMENERKLKSRSYIKDKSYKLWFEHLTPKNQDLFDRMKILTPDLSSNCKFSLDIEGYFCNGTVYFIYYDSDQKNINDYKYLLAILNSGLINYIHKNINTSHLYSKKYRFQTQYMKKYPIKLISKNTKEYKKIISIVDKILENKCENIINLERKLDEIIFEIYNLNKDEIKIINNFNLNCNNK